MRAAFNRFRGVVAAFALTTPLFASFAAAQLPPAVEIVGPVVAVDTAEQDRVVLYDVGNANNPRVLRFDGRAARVWDFSPDGCRVLLTLAEGDAPARLFTARLDGSDVRELVRYELPPVVASAPPGEWGAWEPDWSAQNRIAFTMMRREYAADGSPRAPTFHIAHIPGDAVGVEPAFYSVTGDEHSPRWSPDGAWLAYVSYEERAAGVTADATAEATAEFPADTPMIREADLWVVGADGENKNRLTDFPTGSVAMPRWSPDGDLIGFTYAAAANDDQFYMIGNAPDALPTQLSSRAALALDLTWLPDGTAMLAAARDLQGVAENRLWRIPLVGLADTDAALFNNDPALRYVDYPRFSADDRWLALRSEYALALLDTTANTWALVDAGTLGNTPPVWSPAAFAGEAACQQQ